MRTHTITIPVVLALSFEEALGMAFGICIILWSVWLLYQWELKPNRESRRKQAREYIEEMHRAHRKRLGTKEARQAKRRTPSS